MVHVHVQEENPLNTTILLNKCTKLEFLKVCFHVTFCPTTLLFVRTTWLLIAPFGHYNKVT